MLVFMYGFWYVSDLQASSSLYLEIWNSMFIANFSQSGDEAIQYAQDSAANIPWQW